MHALMAVIQDLVRDALWDCEGVSRPASPSKIAALDPSSARRL